MDKLQDDFVTWEPDLAFPLVNSTITADDIIGAADTTNIYQYGDDDFITLIYRRRIFSQTINDIFQIPASVPLIDTKQLTALEVTQFTANGQVTSNFSGSHTFDILGTPGSQLNVVRYFQGLLQISVQGDFDHGGQLQVTFPELTLNSVPLTTTVFLTTSGGQVFGSASVDITGYSMDLDNNGPNSVPVNYQLNLVNSGGTPPTTFNQMNITNNFLDCRLSYADGDFGQFALQVDPNDVDIDLFENEEDGNIYFEDPKLRIRIKNSFGMPFQGIINTLAASGDQGTTPVDYSIVVPGGIFNIGAAASVGDTVIQEYLFTQGNSNVKNVINDNYASFIYDLDANANPGGGTGNNFATLNSAIEVTADVELPFWGKSNHFRIRDTIDSPLAQAEDFKDNIQEALIRVNTLNGLPADAIIKLYVLDSLYNVTDSLLADGQYVARSGPIDSNGRVTAPVNTNNDIPIDSERAERLFGGKYLIYWADITSTDEAVPNIRIFSTDALSIRIGLRVKLKASPTDLNDL